MVFVIYRNITNLSYSREEKNNFDISTTINDTSNSTTTTTNFGPALGQRYNKMETEVTELH